MDRLERELELKLSSSEHELCSVQVQAKSKPLSRDALNLCNIYFTTDLNMLTFGCAAQSTAQGTWCSEKRDEKLSYRTLQFDKLTNFYTSFVQNIAAVAAWPLERVNSA